MEAVALEVGYKSRKNFYATLQHFTGLTPTGFRRLSDSRAAEIIEMLSLSLQRHGAARRVPRSAR
jgi:AraC-like DNA-binding protein